MQFTTRASLETCDLAIANNLAWRLERDTIDGKCGTSPATSIVTSNQLMSLQSSHLKNWQRQTSQTYLSNAMDDIHLIVVLTDKKDKWSRKGEHMVVTEEKTAAIFFFSEEFI